MDMLRKENHIYSLEEKKKEIRSESKQEPLLNELQTYHKKTNQFKTSFSIRKLKNSVKDSLRTKLIETKIDALSNQERIEIIKAFILGDGEKIIESLMQSGLGQLFLHYTNQIKYHLEQFDKKHLKRLAEHDTDSSTYLNNTASLIIHAMLKKRDPATIIELLKFIMKSCPEDSLSIKTKRNIILEIDSHTEKSALDLAYDAPLPILKQSFVAKINLKMIENILELTLDESQFIVLVRGIIAIQPENKSIIETIDNDYFHLRYKKCIHDINRLIHENKSIPLRNKILNKIPLLAHVRIDENHTRHYYETKLSQYYYGLQLNDNLTSFKKISHFFNKKNGVGIPLQMDAKLDNNSKIAEDIEKLVLTLTSAEKFQDFFDQHNEKKLKTESKKYPNKGREYKPCVITRKDLRKKTPNVNATLFSRQLGLMKERSPFYLDELSPFDQINRSPDIHNYSKNPSDWPLQNPNIPFVASLSGHAYFIVTILEDYMKTYQSDKTLSYDINHFLSCVIATYVKNAFHSVFEMIEVFNEDHIQSIFKKYNVKMEYERLFNYSILLNAMEYATQYTMDHLYKKIIHRELLKEEITVQKHGLIQKIIKETEHVFNNFYLGRVIILDEKQTFLSIRKSVTSFNNLFDNEIKIIKASNSHKISLIKKIISSLKEIAVDASLSNESKIHQVQMLIDQCHSDYSCENGNFSKAIKYIYHYFQSMIIPLPAKLILRTTPEFKELEQNFIQDARSREKKSMFMEPSRVTKGSSRIKNILREFKTSDISFGGKDEFVFIREIHKLENPLLLSQYENAKVRIKKNISRSIPRSQIGIDVEDLSHEVDHSINEVFLYHGTSAFHSIFQQGFNSGKYCRFNQLSGFGPLGKGSYFTDELSKAATFVMCSLCGAHRCHCKTSDGILIPKVILVCKVILGNPDYCLKKKRDLSCATELPIGYHSRIGLSNIFNPSSSFNSNEIAIFHDDQIYPEYAIFYHHYKNMLKPSVWDEELKSSSIASNGMIREITETIKKLSELRALHYDGLNLSKQLELLESIKKNIFSFLETNQEYRTFFESMLLQCDHHINEINLHYQTQTKFFVDSNEEENDAREEPPIFMLP
jgi:hypothetical protein